jgi:hypothetical protein
MRHHYVLDNQEQSANAITLIATFASPCMTCEGVLNPIGLHIQSTQADHASQHASQHRYLYPHIGDLGARQPSPTLVTHAHKVQEISRLP